MRLERRFSPPIDSPPACRIRHQKRMKMKITYFEGSNANERAFMLRVEQGLQSSRLPRLRKVRIRRAMRRPEVVRKAMAEVAEQEYWNEDTTEDEKLRSIDWDSIDWEAILNIVLMIMKMFI